LAVVARNGDAFTGRGEVWPYAAAMSESESAVSAGTRTIAESSRHPGLRVIAVYEVIKTVCLLLIAAAAFHLVHQQNADRVVHWLQHLPLTDGNKLRWKLVSTLAAFGPSKFIAIGLVTLGYALLFAIEGIGLWLGKHWAEWFTVIATGSLIPLELYETVREFGWLKLAMLVGNVAIVIYLTRIALQPRTPVVPD
jgi:uncharacterized membrane protein (DUF2068 family)